MYNDIEDKKKARTLIIDTIKAVENSSDRAYATGLIDMAFELGAINVDEQLKFKAVLYKPELKD